jgi:hypothetical protein
MFATASPEETAIANVSPEPICVEADPSDGSADTLFMVLPLRQCSGRVRYAIRVRGVIARRLWGWISLGRRHTIGYVGLTESVATSFDDEEAHMQGAPPRRPAAIAISRIGGTAGCKTEIREDRFP